MHFFPSLLLLVGLYAVSVGPIMICIYRYAPWLKDAEDACEEIDHCEAAIVPGTTRRV